MWKEINTVLDNLTKENIKLIAAGYVPSEAGGPVWGSEATQKDKDKTAKLSRELSLDRKKTK